MENTDQQLILGLAERLRQAQPAQKDAQAAELIARHIASQPDAVYLLAQAVLVQEDALHTAQAKIAELTDRLAATPPPAPAQTGGGFLSGMFGRSQAPAPAPAPAQAPMEAPQARSGGSFLKTAAAAAAGVAGGGLLLQGLNSAFSGGEQQHETHHLADARQDDWDDDSEQW